MLLLHPGLRRPRAAPLALNIGYLPVNRRCRWPVLVLVTLAAVVTGGVLPFPLWCSLVGMNDGWILAGSLTLAAAWAATWLAIRHDAPIARALSMKPKIVRPVLLTSALGLVLCTSVLPVLNKGHRWEGAGLLAVTGLGFAIGWWLVRADQGHNPYHPEPWLGRLAGGLVGANVAGPAVVVIEAAAKSLSSWSVRIAVTACVLAGVWSVLWGYRKARRVCAKCWRAPAAWCCVSDMTVAAIGVLTLLAWTNWNRVTRVMIT